MPHQESLSTAYIYINNILMSDIRQLVGCGNNRIVLADDDCDADCRWDEKDLPHNVTKVSS